MVSQQLLDYVRQQSAAGVSKEEISKSLIAAGWQASDVHEALSQTIAQPSSVPLSNTNSVTTTRTPLNAGRFERLSRFVTSKNEENPRIGKELIKSVAIYLLAILANFILQIALAVLLGPLAFFLLDFTGIIGPLVVIVFIVRGVQLFLKTRSIVLVLVSVVAPLVIIPSMIVFAISMYSTPTIGFNLYDLPINLFAPETDYIMKKHNLSELNDLASKIKVHPAEICVTGEYRGGRLEWRGDIQFPSGNKSYVAFMGLLENPPGEPRASSGSGLALEAANGTFQPIDTTNQLIGRSDFPADGNFHTWLVSYLLDHVSDKENTINFYYLDSTVSGADQSSLKSFYTLTVPESLIQEAQNRLGKVKNTTNSGEVCVQL